MIDVIIPIYNARKTLELTLMSLDIQTLKNKIVVYLIDDNSNEEYEDIIDKFKTLKINYYKLKENLGSGIARQKGLEVSQNKYIMFVDSDDYMYKANAIEDLYKNMIEGYDYVVGMTYDEKRDRYLFNEGDLHAKMYSRKFIEGNDIKFNNSRFHEDNYFNNLLLSCDPKIKKIEECIYLYRYNKDSITNDEQEFERLEILLKNTNEFLLEAKKRNANKKIVAHLIATKIVYFSLQYLTFDDEKRMLFEGWIIKYKLPFLEYIGRLDYNNIYEDILKVIV